MGTKMSQRTSNAIDKKKIWEDGFTRRTTELTTVNIMWKTVVLSVKLWKERAYRKQL